jgi:hypothetical protein
LQGGGPEPARGLFASCRFGVLWGDGRFEVLVPQWWSRERIFEIALAIAGVLIPFLIIYFVLVD